MPCGKRCGSATIVPEESRLTCQQSSITTYLYPASRMPLVTSASAVSLISSSLTLQPKWFQLFHPIGGSEREARWRRCSIRGSGAECEEEESAEWQERVSFAHKASSGGLSERIVVDGRLLCRRDDFNSTQTKFARASSRRS
jgi:hypothetical protein